MNPLRLKTSNTVFERKQMVLSVAPFFALAIFFAIAPYGGVYPECSEGGNPRPYHQPQGKQQPHPRYQNNNINSNQKKMFKENV